MSRVSINAGLLQMIVNGLRRDFAEGKVIRGEWLAEIEKDVKPIDDGKTDSPSADGWERWFGSVNRPASPFSSVQVQYRNGEKDEGLVHQFNWMHAGHAYDIVAHRIVGEPK